MPKINVKSIDIVYEAFGKGTTVFWLQSPWGGRNPGAYYVAGRLSNKYRTIIWDSPNTGQSGNIIKDTPSEWHLCCEYIYGLCKALGETSVYFVGNSGGGEMALLLAHLYPEIVKGVVMYRPSDTTTSIEKAITKARYYDLAEIAEQGTMKDVLEYSSNPPESRWAEISRWVYKLAINPKAKDELLSYDSKKFSYIMKNWGNWMSQRGFYKANLDDETLRTIKVPVLINPAIDPFHTEEIAKELYEKIPNAKWAPSSIIRSEREMYGAPGEEHNFGGLPDLMPHLEKFLIENDSE